MFRLDSRLEADTICVASLPLSLVLLNRDANYPWTILVPQRENVREIYELCEQDQVQLLQESCALARAMTALFKPHKLNVAALGNVVAQLHLHHIARFTDDAAWPKPIWNEVAPIEYADDGLEKRAQALSKQLEQEGMVLSE